MSRTGGRTLPRIGLTLGSLAVVGAAPAYGASRPARQPGAAPTGPRVVHHFTRRSTVIEHGDTVIWIRLRDSTHARWLTKHADTMTVVIRGDSGVRLQPAPVRPLLPHEVKAVRQLLSFARGNDSLGLLLQPPHQ